MSQVKSIWRWRVPKDLRENLIWRKKVQERCIVDVEFREAMIQCCSEDPIFWINGFGYTYDPRCDPLRKIPFILYPFQEEAILKIIAAIGKQDLLIEKSRDMGASWVNMAACGWCWRFEEEQSFLFVSRVEDYVDKAGNPKALFWKLDYLLENMPPWLQPFGYDKNKHRSKMHIYNPETGSVIDGESTNKRVARGDRRSAILLDEFAAVEQGTSVLSATRDATPCRLFNSTPEGTNNAFYDMRQRFAGTDKILRMHWSEHPLKALGLYTSNDDGNLRIIDTEYVFPGDYRFILDGKLRSPWYDGECERAGSPQEIAQELDIDYLGSGHQFFKPNIVQSYIRGNAREPVYIGDLEHDASDGEPIEFRENPSGNLKIWCPLDKDMKPPSDIKIVLGMDVSAGTGASNSAIAGYNSVTHEKVCEYATPYVRPEALGVQGVALGKWFNNAFLIWERNGPGRQTGAKVIELQYGNIYYQRREEAISKKTSDIPGWQSGKDPKLAVVGEYRSRIEDGSIANYSRDALQETLEYVYAPDGGVVHSRSLSKRDPSGANANHGDRVIADALAVKGFGERKHSAEEKNPTIPYGSLAWRNAEREKAQQQSSRELPEGW